MYRCLHTSIWHVDSSRHHHQKQQSDKSTPTQTSHCTAALHYSHHWQMPLSWINLWFQSHRLQWRTWKSAYTVAAECKLQQTHCRQGGSISDTHERAQETHKHTLKLAPKSEQIHNFKRVNTGTHTYTVNICRHRHEQQLQVLRSTAELIKWQAGGKVNVIFIIPAISQQCRYNVHFLSHVLLAFPPPTSISATGQRYTNRQVWIGADSQNKWGG